MCLHKYNCYLQFYLFQKFIMLSEKTIADGTQDIKISTSSLLSSTYLIKQFVWYMYVLESVLEKNLFTYYAVLQRQASMSKKFFFKFEVVKLITNTSSIFFFSLQILNCPKLKHKNKICSTLNKMCFQKFSCR